MRVAMRKAKNLRQPKLNFCVVIANGTCCITGLLVQVVEPPNTTDPAKEKTKFSSFLVTIGGAVGAVLSLFCILFYRCCIKKNCRGGMDIRVEIPSPKGFLKRWHCSNCFRTKPAQISHLNSVGIDISRASADRLHTSKTRTSGNSLYIAITAGSAYVRAFRPADIKKATRNYISKIGEGGFGSVYYGRLSNNVEVAIKIEILSRVKHPNLVALIGHCQETKDYMLVYEYLPGLTLQQHLHGVYSDRPLDWKMRLKIAVDTAKGLEYLHNNCFPTIIHRDVKSSNILLTVNFDAKVADFGLSKFLEGEALHVSTVARGSSGYLDPEYFKTQRLTHKSDVYSFGVVLLEIISGRRPLDRHLPKDQWSLPDWMRNHLLEGRLGKVVDANLKGNYNVQSVWKVAELAMTCVEPHPIHRPTINEALLELEAAAEIEVEGQMILTLSLSYHREDSYLLDPGRQYHSQTFDRPSTALEKTLCSFQSSSEVKE